MSKVVRVRTEVERKAASLPRYLVIPSTYVALWRLECTTPAEVAINGTSVGRRNLKHWGKARDCWFIDLPAEICRRAGVDTGDEVELEIRRASEELPEEISSLLDSDPVARQAWRELSASRKRMLADHVRSAVRASTRARRASRALLPD